MSEGVIGRTWEPFLKDVPIHAYCSDMQIRTLVKVEKWKPLKPGFLARISRIDQGAKPVLSEPIGSYNVDEVRPMFEKNLRDYTRHFGRKKEVARALAEATSFDQLYELYSSPDAYLEDHYGLKPEN